MIPWKTIKDSLDEIKFNIVDNKVQNIICLDTETTSVFITPDDKVIGYNKDLPAEYYEKCRKVGFVYIWMLSIDDTVFYGRFLEELEIFLNHIIEYVDAKILIFIHNASFEYQFMRNILSDKHEVFARKKRRLMYFRDGAVEFRCSYMLTRLSLANWAKTRKLPVQKKEGDLDYLVIRTPYTHMGNTELDYCEYDCLVMYYGLKEYVNRYGTTWNIPLTQTGIVRRQFNDLLRDDMRHHKRMEKLVIRDFDEYIMALEIFWGGIAHGCMAFSDQILYDIDSYDKKSSYPWEAVSKKYPMTPFVRCKPDNKYFDNDKYSFIITFECFGVETKLWHTYISFSKCQDSRNVELDNGRILSADYLLISCTNIDYEMILQSYEIKEINIIDFKVSINDYLNDNICKFIIELFANKTELDGVEGMEELYRTSKESLNSVYGNMVTRDITDEIFINCVTGKWDVNELTPEIFYDKTHKKLRKISKLNTSFYHGVWITAYGRKAIWESIIATDGDSAYLDTDSNKLRNAELYKGWFDEYNRNIYKEHEKIAKRLGISPDRLHPKRPDGKECAMGVFEHDGHYKQFRTLGAKKYAYIDDKDKIHITVSGVRKEAASQIKSLEEFTNDLVFDYDHGKKLMLHYNDNQPYIVVNYGEYDEFACMYKYGVCAQPTTYKLSLGGDYTKLLKDYIMLRSKCLYAIDFVRERQKKYGKKKTL